MIWHLILGRFVRLCTLYQRPPAWNLDLLKQVGRMFPFHSPLRHHRDRCSGFALYRKPYREATRRRWYTHVSSSNRIGDDLLRTMRPRSSRILLETDTVSPRAGILGGLKVVEA